MSPTNFHQYHHAKRDTITLTTPYPPPLKINKDSHFIKKSSPSSSSSSNSSLVKGISGMVKPPHRHPVIIYTHSPKVIHTHPRDFMALVQKLTGLSRSDDDDVPKDKSYAPNGMSEEENKCAKTNGNDDNESSSVITDENCSSIGEGQVNSCFVNPIFDPLNTCMTNIPLFTPNSAEFLCASQPFYNYRDSFFFNPNMRSSISSSSALEGMNELIREY